MTSYERLLGIVANWAAILTAAVAVVAFGLYHWERRQKRLRLEDYLKSEKTKGTDQGQRGMQHLVARVGMSESDVLDIAFRSKRIRRVTRVDEDGFATMVMLEYISK